MTVEPKPTEAALLYLRQTHPKEMPQLVISLGSHTVHAVYTIRPSQLANLARDAVSMAIPNSSQWSEMWSRKFDYPERV